MSNPRSPLTTIVGVVLIIVAGIELAMPLFDGNPATSPDYNHFLFVLGGVGFILSKDWNSTHTKK